MHMHGDAIWHFENWQKVNRFLRMCCLLEEVHRARYVKLSGATVVTGQTKHDFPTEADYCW